VASKKWCHRGRPLRLRIGGYEFAKKGVLRYDLTDPYHLAVGLSWGGFLLWVGGVYVATNLFFGAFYTLCHGSVANATSFSDAVFFSAETLTTVGYGDMHPASLSGHLAAAFESLCGLVMTAILTGLTFVRFSRPKARLLYADRAVVTHRNGKPTLMIRLANARPSIITGAEATLSVLMPARTREEQFFRRIQVLRLERPVNPIFVLTWTIAHVIDASSPLSGFGPDAPFPDNFRLVLSVTGRDRTLAAEVHDIRDWGPDDVVFGCRYETTVGFDEDGRTTADLTRISAIEPDPICANR
jgi:inward rectifier potassium channel